MSYVIASLHTTLQHRGAGRSSAGRSRYFGQRLHNTFSSAAWTPFYAIWTTDLQQFDDGDTGTLPNVIGKTKMKLQKVAIAI